MLKNAQPSDLFIAAVRRGYDAELRENPYKSVTCSAIWNRVVAECLQASRGFVTMFAWDESKAKNINRIGTIAEAIDRHLVPGLKLEADRVDRRRYIVVREDLQR